MFKYLCWSSLAKQIWWCHIWRLRWVLFGLLRWMLTNHRWWRTFKKLFLYIPCESHLKRHLFFKKRHSTTHCYIFTMHHLYNYHKALFTTNGVANVTTSIMVSQMRHQKTNEYKCSQKKLSQMWHRFFFLRKSFLGCINTMILKMAQMVKKWWAVWAV